MPDFEPSVRLGIWIKSIGNDTGGLEHKALLNAVDAANVKGTVTWIRNGSGAPIAAVVPRGFAEELAMLRESARAQTEENVQIVSALAELHRAVEEMIERGGDFPIVCDNGCPDGWRGIHKMSCSKARQAGAP